MKSLTTLQHHLLVELGRQCSVDTTRDEKTLISRAEHEGDSFITITLPAFAKMLERAIEAGQWQSEELTSFRHLRGLPVFLRGFLLRVFSENGELLDAFDTECVWAVRQFCLFSQKIERDCSPKRVADAFTSYVETDREVGEHFSRIPTGLLEELKVEFVTIYRSLLQSCENKIFNFDLVPHHGPGATAQRTRPAQKWKLDYWPERLEGCFPRWRYGRLPSQRWESDFCEPGSEIPVRVISVPKTMVTPRIIAIEPDVMQFAQQGLKDVIYREVEDGYLKAFIGFMDQERNRNMALQGSIDSSLSTLDLSEASDRLSYELILYLLQDFPNVRDFVSASRSTRANVPGHGVVPLAKYASMGSALTFPLEAMVFLAIAHLGCQDAGLPRDIQRLEGSLSVFGDDIIIPGCATATTISRLEAYGLKVNKHKSFWNGPFRESCGAEYVNGVDVSIERIRHDLPAHRKDATAIAACVDLSNRLFRAGLWSTSTYLKEQVMKPLGLRIPVAGDVERGLAYFTFVECLSSDRFSTDLHRYEQRRPTLVPTRVDYVYEGYEGLLDWFTEKELTTLPRDRDSSQERPSAFSIYTRWTPISF